MNGLYPRARFVRTSQLTHPLLAQGPALFEGLAEELGNDRLLRRCSTSCRDWTRTACPVVPRDVLLVPRVSSSRDAIQPRCTSHDARAGNVLRQPVFNHKGIAFCFKSKIYAGAPIHGSHARLPSMSAMHQTLRSFAPPTSPTAPPRRRLRSQCPRYRHWTCFRASPHA